MLATAIWVTNPFDHSKADRITVEAGSTSIREASYRLLGAEKEFELPTVCLLNGKPLLRKDWDRSIDKGDVVCFATQPAAPAWVWWLVAIVVGVGLYLSIPKPTFEGTPDTALSLSGQRNRNRLGQPIECGYGRVRMYPSLAARSWNRFIDNDQWQYSLYSMGQGEWAIESMLIEDTLVNEFEDVEVEVFEPGELVTSFPDNVDTSTLVDSIELLAVGEEDRPEDGGWYGPFAASDASSPTNRVEVDIVFPQGLRYNRSSGGTREHDVDVEFQYRPIDNSGLPTGDGTWSNLVTRKITDNTSDPVRKTFGADVTEGRYEVRGRRANSLGDTQERYQEKTYWSALRGFLPSTKTYPVTVISVAAKAQVNFSDQATSRFNVWATRKLPTWSPSGGWTAPVATRSKIWALCDAWRSTYGGNLPDTYLDLPTLYALDQKYDERREYFDHIFDQKITVWEAMRLILASGRAIPILNGSKVSAIRDEPRDTPEMLFTDSNINKGSLAISVDHVRLGEEDGLEMEYIDPQTFLPATVLCTLEDEGDEGLQPEKDKIAGITEELVAFREGLYRRARRVYERVNVVFETNRIGYLVRQGSLIAVSTKRLKASTSGRVTGYDEASRTLTLSTRVSFNGITEPAVFITTRDGGVSSALAVTQGADARTLILTGSEGLDLSQYNFDRTATLPTFAFGQTSEFYALCVVGSVEPVDQDRVKIESYVYRPEVHTFDDRVPEGFSDRMPSAVPAIGYVTGLEIDPLSSNTVTALLRWNPTYGAKRYVAQRSGNGTDWTDIMTVSQPWVRFGVEPGSLEYFRVSAINLRQGPWNTIGPVVVGAQYVNALEDDEGNVLFDGEGNFLAGPSFIGTGSFGAVDQELINIYNSFQSIQGALNGVLPPSQQIKPITPINPIDSLPQELD